LLLSARWQACKRVFFVVSEFGQGFKLLFLLRRIGWQNFGGILLFRGAGWQGIKRAGCVARGKFEALGSIFLGALAL